MSVYAGTVPLVLCNTPGYFQRRGSTTGFTAPLGRLYVYAELETQTSPGPGEQI